MDDKQRLTEVCAKLDSRLFWTPILLAAHHAAFSAQMAMAERDRVMKQIEDQRNNPSAFDRWLLGKI